MGQEVVCRVRVGDREAEAKALLESAEILVRGELRARIPFSEVSTLAVEDGVLSVTYPGGTAAFELGPKAARWAERIRNPPTLLDKLGVKPGMRVAVFGVDDGAFLELLRERAGSVVETEPAEPVDILLLQVDHPRSLGRVASLEPLIGRDGAIWVVFPRGRADLREADVLAAGRSAGFVDTKTARFSDTHSSNRFQIPKARR